MGPPLALINLYALHLTGKLPDDRGNIVVMLSSEGIDFSFSILLFCKFGWEILHCDVYVYLSIYPCKSSAVCRNVKSMKFSIKTLTVLD